MASQELKPVSPIRQHLLLFLLVFVGYLCQVCIVPYIRVGGVSPNLLLCLLGIITVSYGKLRTFWAACCFGILMEIMVPTVTYVSLALYPIVSLFCSFGFADKVKPLTETDTKPLARFFQKPGVRSVLCAMANAMVHEVIHLVYIYINGTSLNRDHFTRALTAILLTSLLTFVLLFPLRRLIRPRKRRQKQKSVEEELAAARSAESAPAV